MGSVTHGKRDRGGAKVHAGSSGTRGDVGDAGRHGREGYVGDAGRHGREGYVGEGRAQDHASVMSPLPKLAHCALAFVVCTATHAQSPFTP